MSIPIEILILQGDSRYNLKFEITEEKRDFNKLVGAVLTKIFRFSNKLRYSNSKSYIKSNVPIDLIIKEGDNTIIDTTDKKYDFIRQSFVIGNTNESKKKFGKVFFHASNALKDIEDVNDIELTIGVPGFIEGKRKSVTTTAYERNVEARQICLNHHGYSCKACGFNFYDVYGEIGLNYIQVHHITPIASIGKRYQIDPINDLIPLCANCHSMIHRKKEVLTVEELKEALNIK